MTMHPEPQTIVAPRLPAPRPGLGLGGLGLVCLGVHVPPASGVQAVAELWIHLGVPGVGTSEKWGRAFHFQTIKK